MPRAAKGKTRRAAGLLLVAVLAGAGGAEASIPRPEASAELAAWPPPLPDAPSLVDLGREPAAPATTTAAAAAAAAGDRFGLFDPGPAAGLFAATRPSARARLEAETRLRVHDLELSVRIGLEPLEVAARTGFTVFGRRETRRGSENRWYDPQLGRFVSVDPLGYVDGPNLYQYGLNNPVNFSDPLGLNSTDCQFEGTCEQERQALAALQEHNLAWQRWEDQESLKGGLALMQQVGPEVSESDLQLALLEYFRSRPRVTKSEAAGLVVALTGPGEGVNEVLGEITAARWLPLLEAYLINYPLAVTGGELAIGARTFLMTVRQLGWRAALQQLSGGAATTGEATVNLYRAVSQAELDDVLQFGFRPGPGTMETKLFATSADDASFFARDVLFPLDRKPLTILEVEVPEGLSSRLVRFTADGKPTVAVDPGLLQEFNAAVAVRPLNYAPLPSP